MNTTTIVNFRKKTGMTQVQFAKKMGMSPAWVGAVEAGRISTVTDKVRVRLKKLKAKTRS